jgi:hypothetical protein
MKKITHLILFTFIITLVSCEKSEKKNNNLINKNGKVISSLIQKYNAEPWEPNAEDFTYDLQKKFIDEKKLISFSGDISDITKLDTTYLLSFRNDEIEAKSLGVFRRNYIVLISLSQEKFSKFEKQRKSKNHSSNAFYIIKATKISNKLPVLASDFKLDGEDSYSKLSFAFNETLLILNGELVDFYIKESDEIED